MLHYDGRQLYLVPFPRRGNNLQQEPAVSNQPDQPQPYTGQPEGYVPPGYIAPPVAPYQDAQYQAPQEQVPQQQAAQYPTPQYQADQYQTPQYPAPASQGMYNGQNQQFQTPQASPYAQQFPNPQGPQYAAPTYYQGGPGYMEANSGPRGLSLTSMIIGLASLVVGFGFLLIPQIVGVILGHLGLGRENPQGRAFAVTGLITNYLALLIFGGLYALMFIGIMSSGSY